MMLDDMQDSCTVYMYNSPRSLSLSVHHPVGEDEAGRAVSSVNLRPPPVLRRGVLPADE